MGRGVCLIPYVYVLTYICMYIHYCTTDAAPHPSKYTDIATRTGLVCLALLPKPQTIFTILDRLAYQDYCPDTFIRCYNCDITTRIWRIKVFLLGSSRSNRKNAFVLDHFSLRFFNDIIFLTKYKKLIWYCLKTIAKIPYQTWLLSFWVFYLTNVYKSNKYEMKTFHRSNWHKLLCWSTYCTSGSYLEQQNSSTK